MPAKKRAQVPRVQKQGAMQRVSSKQSPSEATLGVMRDLVHCLVKNNVPDPTLVTSLTNYFNNLQQTTDLMGLAVFEHNISKLLRVSEGIEVLHKEILDPKKIRNNIKADASYGLELMKILYKESAVATLILEGKTKLFDTDKLAKAPHLQPPSDNLPTDKISKLSPRRRERIINIIEALVNDDDNDDDRDPEPTDTYDGGGGEAAGSDSGGGAGRSGSDSGGGDGGENPI